MNRKDGEEENKKQLHHRTSAIRNRTSIPFNTTSKQEEEEGIKDKIREHDHKFAFFFNSLRRRLLLLLLLLFEHYDQVNDPRPLLLSQRREERKKVKRPSHRGRATDVFITRQTLNQSPLSPTTSSSPHHLSRPHPQPLFLSPFPFPPHKPQSRPRPTAPSCSTFTTSHPLTETPPPSPCY